MTIQRIMKLAILFFFIQACIPMMSSAHSTGVSIEREVDGYIIDIGYDSTPIVAGSPVRFDFALYEAQGSGNVAFDRIWLRIEDEERTIFAGGIAHASFGGTGALVLFPEAGIYTLSARFEQAEKGIVTLETPITVEKQEGETARLPWWIALFLCFVALGVGFFMGRRKTL